VHQPVRLAVQPVTDVVVHFHPVKAVPEHIYQGVAAPVRVGEDREGSLVRAVSRAASSPSSWCKAVSFPRQTTWYSAPVRSVPSSSTPSNHSRRSSLSPHPSARDNRQVDLPRRKATDNWTDVALVPPLLPKVTVSMPVGEAPISTGAEIKGSTLAHG
jgi:hypothetical protein